MSHVLNPFFRLEHHVAPDTISPAVSEDDDNILRVASSTPVNDLASAIAHACYEGKHPTLRAIGAGAVNQAVKACVIAGSYLAQKAMTLSVRPGFVTVPMPVKGGNPGETEDVSAIVFRVVVN